MVVMYPKTNVIFLLLLVLIQIDDIEGWTTATSNNCNLLGKIGGILHTPGGRYLSTSTTKKNTRSWEIFLSSPGNSQQPEEDIPVERTSFDQAGKSLNEQEDQKRLDQMGEFDVEVVRDIFLDLLYIAM